MTQDTIAKFSVTPMCLNVIAHSSVTVDSHKYLYIEFHTEKKLIQQYSEFRYIYGVEKRSEMK